MTKVIRITITETVKVTATMMKEVLPKIMEVSDLANEVVFIYMCLSY